MLLMRENPLLGPLEGVGPENLDFFGPKLHSLGSLAFEGPKKSWFSGPTPSNGSRNVFSRIKIITSRATTTGTGILTVNTFNALEGENLGVHGLTEVGHQVEVGQAHALQTPVLYIYATKLIGTCTSKGVLICGTQLKKAPWHDYV